MKRFVIHIEREGSNEEERTVILARDLDHALDKAHSLYGEDVVTRVRPELTPTIGN